MNLLFLLLLLPLASADILHDHLNNNVDTSVDPCDNFFLHVCSQSVDDTDFPFWNITYFYQDIASEFSDISQSRNLPIINDIKNFKKTIKHKPAFNRSLFENLVRERCDDNNDCYREEFKYFAEFYMEKTNETNDRLKYFNSTLDRYNRDEILQILPSIVESTYARVKKRPDNIEKMAFDFYSALINRLFVMEKLQEDNIFEKIADIKDDVEQFKALIVEKLRNTPWLNEKDEIGLSLLSQFEDKINDILVYYDLDESDRDLELLRSINSKFAKNYYKRKERSTGIEILDTYYSIISAVGSFFLSVDPEEIMLVLRVKDELEKNAFYIPLVNKVGILAPILYPELTDNSTLNKNYNLFSTIGHEIFHSIIRKEWAEKSTSFKKGMNCMNDHYNITCNIYGKGSCNSGTQTFEEDGPDVEGLRINYEFLSQNYNETEMKEIVFTSLISPLTVTREQTLFYLHGIDYCEIMRKVSNHTDGHSEAQVRVNGVVTQMPEFTRAFSCSSGQEMYTDKNRTCNLFGPDSK